MGRVLPVVEAVGESRCQGLHKREEVQRSSGKSQDVTHASHKHSTIGAACNLFRNTATKRWKWMDTVIER